MKAPENKGSRAMLSQRPAPMRAYFAPDTLSFPAEHLVEAAGAAFPVTMNIEPTFRCNSNCIMCPRTLATRPVGDMDFGLFEKICTEMAIHGGVKVVNFHKDGEPLLHPRLEEMISLARGSGACAFTHFNTNALLLDAERSRRLLDAPIDDITMSIDAVTEETFALVKRAGKLATVERNVERLLELREKRGQKTPWVRAKICAMPETEHEIEAFIQRWEPVADETQVQNVHNYGGGARDAMADDTERYPCQFWWSNMSVNWDGTVSVCSVDFSGEVILGDLNSESIADIYRGESYAIHRKAMLDGDYRSHATCADCTVWKVGPDQSAWLKKLHRGA